MRKTKILWCLLALLCLLAVATVVVRLNLWNIRGVQPSGLYLQYKDMPGIQASFIKDKYINDSISIPVTLLQAEDSAAFFMLLKELGKPDDMIKYMYKYVKDDQSRFVKLNPKGHPELPQDSVGGNNEVVATFPVQRAVIIFHTETEEQIDIVMKANFLKKIKYEESI